MTAFTTPPPAASHTGTSEETASAATHVARMYLTELKLFFRESQVLVFVFGFPVVTVLVLGGVFGTDTDDSGFEFINPAHFYVAAYFGVVLSAIGLIMLPSHVAGYRERGVLRRYETAGFARWVFPTVQFLCGITFALFGFASLLITAVLSNGIPDMQDPSRTLLGLALGTLAFISIGVALGMVLPSSRAAQGLGLTMFFPMFLLAGGGPPPEALTAGMRNVANFLPLTHVIRSSQEPWLGLGDGTNHLVIVIALLLVSTAVWLWRSQQTSRAA